MIKGRDSGITKSSWLLSWYSYHNKSENSLRIPHVTLTNETAGLSVANVISLEHPDLVEGLSVSNITIFFDRNPSLLPNRA